MIDSITPALLLDYDKMRANIRRITKRLESAGVKLRLHGKAAKSADIAKECGPEAGVAASTLAEAEYYRANGITDIMYSVGVTPDKINTINELAKKGAQLKIVVDNLDTARILAATDLHPATGILVEIDSDGYSGGLRPDEPGLLAIASCLARSGKTITGVMTRARSILTLPSANPEACGKLADMETAAARRAAARLRLAGTPCPVVSVGSTATALFGNDFEGITEAHAGVFPFMDCTMASLAICDLGDIAISVLSTVISTRKDGRIIIDTGWRALSFDRGHNFERFGYGVVCNEAGAILPGLRLTELHQEHGVITQEDGSPLLQPRPGSRLRILPNHACATANSFSVFNVISGSQPASRWQRCQGW